MRLLAVRLHDVYMRVSLTEEELELELRRFIGKYEFPCIGAWDGFHVYVFSKLKQFYSFKNCSTVTNWLETLTLVRNIKKNFYAAIGTPSQEAHILEC